MCVSHEAPLARLSLQNGVVLLAGDARIKKYAEEYATKLDAERGCGGTPGATPMSMPGSMAPPVGTPSRAPS